MIGRDRPYAISEKSVSDGLERSMVIDEGVRIPMHASTLHLSLAFKEGVGLFNVLLIKGGL
jgi:hypothetical protein